MVHPAGCPPPLAGRTTFLAASAVPLFWQNQKFCFIFDFYETYGRPAASIEQKHDPAAVAAASDGSSTASHAYDPNLPCVSLVSLRGSKQARGGRGRMV